MRKNNEFITNEIIRLYQEGNSINEIIEVVDVNYDSVLRLLKRKGVYVAPVKKKTDKEELLDLIEKSCKAKEDSPKTEKWLLTDKILNEEEFEFAGKIFNSKKGLLIYKAETSEVIKKLFKEGIPPKIIAKNLGLSLTLVTRLLKEADDKK